MSLMGILCCHHKFVFGFDETKQNCLIDAREQGKKKLHDALYEVKPNPALMISLMDKHELSLSARLAQSGFDKKFPHLVNALEEESNQTPFAERHLLGQSLYQALRFSRFEQLRSAKLFAKPELELYLKASCLPIPLFHKLFNAHLFRIDYQQFKQ
ncbi:hypothetical protein [Dongshaea marina]|uniref:hypothetical protein n=1 Tax=Dongshaea marina TaxID=2047966 RepID=UPI000D3E10F3|nr:hypothetical protein [Dongshaea marina]